MTKKILFLLAALALLPAFLSGCAIKDPENWQRSESGLGSHPDEEGGVRVQ